MLAWLLILGGAGVGGGWLVRTGHWRLALWPFRIPAARMTVKKLGLKIDDARSAERVDAILASFAGGFNRMLTSASEQDARSYCGELPAMLEPFAEEGVAMGYLPRRLFSWNPDEFEDRIVRPRPDMRYLYYVGLGFWAGMRRYPAAKLHALVQGLDPLHRYLCYDGYGFKVAFFDHVRDSGAFNRLHDLEGYARRAAFQGVGRALWFRYMSDPARLRQQFAALGEHAVDAAAGAGLATVFVNPDRLEVARELGSSLPEAWQPHFHLGMCFALKARIINHPDEFDRLMNREGESARDAVYASVRECDRIELLVRSEGLGDRGYEVWRERVTAWLTQQIEFPMRGLKAGALDGKAEVKKEQAEVRES